MKNQADRSLTGVVRRWGLPLAAVGGGAAMAFALPTVFPIVGRRELLPGGELTPLAYVALAPLIAALRGRSPRTAFLWGFVASIAYYSVGIWWVYVAMHTFGGIPTGLSVAILYLLIGYLAVYWGAAFAIASFVTSRVHVPRWLVLAAAFTALELLRDYLFSGFPWANVGYALARDRWGVQWASLFGVYGLAFVALWVNASLADLFTERPGNRRTAAGLALFAGLVLPHLYGALRLPGLERAAARAPSLEVAVVQGNIDQKIKNAAKRGGPMTYQEYEDFILDRYLPLSHQADREGADFIVWPEASFPGQLPLQPTHVPAVFGEPFRSQLLIGAVTAGRRADRSVLTNSALAIDPQFEVVGEYDKHHLVPFGEYVPLEKSLHLPIHKVVPDIGFFDPGERLEVLSVTGRNGTHARYGPLICFDAIFPEIGVEFGREDPDFLVNITNDAWYGFSSAAYQFLSIVAVRAVETGKPIVRAANTGISAFLDPTGRILAHTEIGLVDSDSDSISADSAVPPTLLMGRVPLMPGRTPYVVIGDTFAYLCAAATLLFWLVAKRRSHAHRRTP